MHTAQSMHSSGSMTRKLGPSWKQSTGHTSTQSVYLHLMQFSVTTKVIAIGSLCTGDSVMQAPDMAWRKRKNPAGAGFPGRPAQGADRSRGWPALYGAPYGTRTRVSALRGLRPGPLDEGSGASGQCPSRPLRPAGDRLGRAAC